MYLPGVIFIKHLKLRENFDTEVKQNHKTLKKKIMIGYR